MRNICTRRARVHEPSDAELDRALSLGVRGTGYGKPKDRGHGRAVRQEEGLAPSGVCQR